MHKNFDAGPRVYYLEHTELTVYKAHAADACSGNYCTIHNRSKHSMRKFPQHWRADRAIMERICPHGIGHPDPDEINLDIAGRSIHGCCGICCKGAYSAAK